jgi:hypothetical protein
MRFPVSFSLSCSETLNHNVLLPLSTVAPNRLPLTLKLLRDDVERGLGGEVHVFLCVLAVQHICIALGTQHSELGTVGALPAPRSPVPAVL